jgi:hypothetical protein
MLDYTPEGLVLQSGRSGIRLRKVGGGRFIFCLVFESGGDGLSSEVLTEPFSLQDLGSFFWLSGPIWERQASAIELREGVSEGHRDYILRQALDQGVLRFSCFVNDECLVFVAKLGSGALNQAEGRSPVQRISRFIQEGAEMISVK